MRRKARVNINLDPEVAKKARELGLNISKIAENALREYIRRLGVPVSSSNPEKHNTDKPNSVWWGRPDLNRGHESPSLVA